MEDSTSEAFNIDTVQLGPSVVPEEGLDDLSFVKALIVSAGGVFLAGILFAIAAAVFGKSILKRLIER